MERTPDGAFTGALNLLVTNHTTSDLFTFFLSFKLQLFPMAGGRESIFAFFPPRRFYDCICYDVEEKLPSWEKTSLTHVDMLWYTIF